MTTPYTIEDAKKSTLMNKTKPQIITLLMEKIHIRDKQNSDANHRIFQLENELRDLNKKFNINTSSENQLMTVLKDANNLPTLEPPVHDPVVMYNHTLAVKVEQENTQLRNKINELNEDIKDLKDARTIITKDYATLENDNKKLKNDFQNLKDTHGGEFQVITDMFDISYQATWDEVYEELEKLKKLKNDFEELVCECNDFDNLKKAHKILKEELVDSKHAYLLMKKEKDSIEQNYEVLDNQVKTGTAKRYYAMEERCKNEQAQKEHYERLMTEYKGKVIEADMFRNSLKKFIKTPSYLGF